MRLKDKRGLTAMVDAMIFIVIIGLAVTAMFAFDNDEARADDASSISESIFTSKMKMNDLFDTEESRLVGVPDLIAVYILTEGGKVMDYIRDILDSMMHREGSYLLEIEYLGHVVSIGTGAGDPVSGSVKEYTVTYGGSIRTDLTLY